jgi:hypothetical protein
MPTSSEILTKIKPIYETMPGWNAPTTGIRKWDDLPENAKKSSPKRQYKQKKHRFKKPVLLNIKFHSI